MHTFGPDRRVRHPADYRRVFSDRKKRLHSPHFVMSYTHSTSGFARMGVVVSKKSAKRAVSRNRIKRLVREYFRLQQDTLKPNDFVIIAKPTAKTASNDEIRQCLSSLLKP